jgi:hypothetical protein
MENGIGYVEIWFNLTDPYGTNPIYALGGLDINVTLDPTKGEIPDGGCHFIPGHPWDAQHDCNTWIEGDNGAWMIAQVSVCPPPPLGLVPGVYPIVNLTIQCYEGCSGPLDLVFSFDEPRVTQMYDSYGVSFPDDIWENGQFPCGGVVSFEKELVQGWNLVSLPLTPENNSTSVVLGNDTIVYDKVYRYDATSKEFEDGTTGTMDPGIGYFVNITTAGIWSYEGHSYVEMSIDLKQGLNLVGWVNETGSALSDALDSIDDKYNYVAQWNATSPSYEVYDANAPPEVPEFIDFEMVERGNGYWIAAKEDCTLTVS